MNGSVKQIQMQAAIDQGTAGFRDWWNEMSRRERVRWFDGITGTIASLKDYDADEDVTSTMPVRQLKLVLWATLVRAAEQELESADPCFVGTEVEDE